MGDCAAHCNRTEVNTLLAFISLAYIFGLCRKKCDSIGDPPLKCQLKRRHTNDEMISGDDEEKPKKIQMSEVRFPWEAAIPQYSLPVTTTNRGSEKHQAEKKSSTTGNAQEQLNFVASMTFASGSLRQPSCPCCI